MTRVELLNPNTGRPDGTVDADKYEAMKAALLKVIPKDEAGVPFKELTELVRPLLPDEVYAGASIVWYVTAVKLDLEARGLLERVPKRRPQHVRRT